MFTTDNGGASNGFDSNHASNYPFRGIKTSLFEGISSFSPKKRLLKMLLYFICSIKHLKSHLDNITQTTYNEFIKSD